MFDPSFKGVKRDFSKKTEVNFVRMCLVLYQMIPNLDREDHDTEVRGNGHATGVR